MKPMPHAPALLRHTQKGARRTTRRTTTRTKSLLAAALLAACGAPFGDDTATSGPPGDAGVEGGDARDAQDASVVPPGCDINAEPKDAPNCVVDEVGAFVAPTGDDTATGRKDEPVRSITKALELANARKLPRIYVCNGTYFDRPIAVSSIGLYGGFSCKDWRYDPDARSRITPPSPGPALEFRNGPDVTVSDLVVEPGDGTEAEPSSIAIFARGSTVRLIRVSAKAGNGFDGKDATTGSNYDVTLSRGNAKIAGNSASGTNGAATQTCAGLCKDNVASTGGAGGHGTTTPTAGASGAPGLGAGTGGLPSGSCGDGGGGVGGAPAPDGPQAPASTRSGVLTVMGWQPAEGAAGPNGGPGQGGGGGGGFSSATLGAGGGGGCGGCGGAGGSAASGGGASIAVAAFESRLIVSASHLISAKAGKGGSGSPGQPGQHGGYGGIQTSGGCHAGSGGTGGAGGASAGGAGGVSAGVLATHPDWITINADTFFTPG